MLVKTQLSLTPVCAQSCCVRRGGKQMWRSLCLWKTRRKTLFTAYTFTRTHARTRARVYRRTPFLKTLPLPTHFHSSQQPFHLVWSQDANIFNPATHATGNVLLSLIASKPTAQNAPTSDPLNPFCVCVRERQKQSSNWKQQLCLANPQVKCHVQCDISHKLICVFKKKKENKMHLQCRKSQSQTRMAFVSLLDQQLLTINT